MQIKNGTWKDVINLIQLLSGNEYITKRLLIKEYNSYQLENKEKEWSIDKGEILLLGKEEDISFLSSNKEYNICDIRKELHKLYDQNKTFIIGNNFYYPHGIELNYNKLEIPTDMNNIIYYGNRNDYLGIIAKEVYNYILCSGIEVDDKDIEYLNKKKTKKIC